MKKPGKCVHFNGFQNAACDAGIAYKSVEKPAPDGKGKNFPCWAERTGQTTCAKLEFPTAEQIAADDAKWKIRFEGTMNARAAIVEHLGGPWKKGMGGGIGVIDCPVCKVKDALHFSRAGYNGHIHANCQTPECVSWME